MKYTLSDVLGPLLNRFYRCGVVLCGVVGVVCVFVFLTFLGNGSISLSLLKITCFRRSHINF